MLKNKLRQYLNYFLYLFVFLLPWQTRYIFFSGEINCQIFSGS